MTSRVPAAEENEELQFSLEIAKNEVESLNGVPVPIRDEDCCRYCNKPLFGGRFAATYKGKAVVTDVHRKCAPSAYEAVCANEGIEVRTQCVVIRQK